MKGPDKSGHQTIVEIVPDHNQKNGNAFHNINITNPCCLSAHPCYEPRLFCNDVTERIIYYNIKVGNMQCRLTGILEDSIIILI